jgi:rubrerythrin
MSMDTTSASAWICTVCGYVHTGPEPPERCPVCGAPPEQFEPYSRPPGGFQTASPSA